MHLACCQYDIAWENKAENYKTVARLLKQARPPAGSLVTLPEMSFTGFSMDVSAIAEKENGPSEQHLASLAHKQGIYVLGGLVASAENGSGLNQSVCLSPRGERVGVYAKLQPFTPGDEAKHYAAGRDVVTYQCGEAVIAPFICYDLRFPEHFRKAARARPHVYVVIANWPAPRIHHWLRLLQARAIENQAYVVGVNRTGNDPRYSYCGQSAIVDWHGEFIARAGAGEEVIAADLDFNALAEYRRAFPFLDDMRPSV